MSLGTVLLVLHIAAAGVWLGANVMQAVVPSQIAPHGAEATAGWFRVAGSLSKKLYMPASIVLLATGIWMVLRTDSYGFGSLFVTVGFAMIIVGAVLGIVVFGPGSEVAAQAVEAGDESRIKAATSRLAAFGTVDTLLLLFTITVMVNRWT